MSCLADRRNEVTKAKAEAIRLRAARRTSIQPTVRFPNDAGTIFK
jgi:hypothetical protein